MIYNSNFWKRCMKENDLIDVAGVTAKLTEITPSDRNGERWELHFTMHAKNRRHISNITWDYLREDHCNEFSFENNQGDKLNYLYSTIYPYNKDKKAIDWKMRIFELDADSTFCFGINSTNFV